MKNLLFSLLVISTSVVSASQDSAPSRLPFGDGSVPSGWTYSALGEFERRLQELPFEVKGVLERPIGNGRSVSIFVTMLPVQKGAARRPANLWSRIDGIFAPEGIVAVKSYELGVQSNVGAGRRGTFRESKISRAGIATNIGAFQSSLKYHEVFLVLRGSDADYRQELPQLKELIREIKVD